MSPQASHVGRRVDWPPGYQFVQRRSPSPDEDRSADAEVKARRPPVVSQGLTAPPRDDRLDEDVGNRARREIAVPVGEPGPRGPG